MPLLFACSHSSRIEKLEREVRTLRVQLGELEADWSLFQATPDGRWVYPKKKGDSEDESERKKERRAKK